MCFFLDESLFGHIYKEQITDLILIINENRKELTLAEYTKNVYAIILPLFKNLKHLSVTLLSTNNHPSVFSYNYPSLLLHNLSPMTFSSSTITKLCISVCDFDDCLDLLDGRLKQLTTFIVEVDHIYDEITRFHDMVSLLFSH
jgi:hypothetical protein